MAKSLRNAYWFSILAVVYCLLVPSAAACEIKIRTYLFPPFAMQDQDGHWSGIDMDYAKVLFDELDCQYTYVEVPWARAIELLKLGHVDMMLNVTKTPEREKYFHFVGPQRMETLRFVTKKGVMDKVSNWNQFKTLNVTLMRQRGAFIGHRFEQLLFENPLLKKRLLYLVNNSMKIDLIRKGRAMGFFAENAFLEHEFAKNPDYSILEMHPIIINKEPVYYAFSKVSMTAGQIEKITAAYERLYADKKIQAVEGHYDEY